MTSARLARFGSLLADPTRSEILTTLMDKKAYTGSELARHIGVAHSTTSEHLARLLDAGMVTVEPQGRHRYYRLEDPAIAELVEVLGSIPDPPPPALPEPPKALTFARTCYDHLAGEVAVAIFDGLIEDGRLRPVDVPVLALTGDGVSLFEDMGVDLSKLDSTRRPRARTCLDWTERRHHLGGSLGALLLDHMLTMRWIVPGSRPRSMQVTELGRDELDRCFGGTYSRTSSPATGTTEAGTSRRSHQA